MATDNIAIVRALIDGLAQLNVADLVDRFERSDESGESAVTAAAPLLAMIDPEVVWDVSALDMPDMGVFRGHDGVVAFWRQWLAEWDTWSFEASNFEELGDHVLYDVVNRGRSKRMGAQMDWRQAQVMTLRAGKLLAYAVFSNRADALRAVR